MILVAVHGVWTRWGWPGTASPAVSRNATGLRVGDTLRGRLSTNTASYPQVGGAYPHAQARAQRSLFGVQQLAEGVDVPAEVVVLAHLAFDLLAAVQHGRVIASAEGFADPQQRRLGLLAHEVHRDLPRQDDLLIARLAPELVRRDPVVLRDRLDDALR